jgi:hypothetical protein
MRKRHFKRSSKRPSNRYEVGYKRPPAVFRFSKGVSGNPEGKRKISFIVTAASLSTVHAITDSFLERNCRKIRD